MLWPVSLKAGCLVLLFVIYLSIITATQNTATHVTSQIKRLSSQIPVASTVLSSLETHANVDPSFTYAQPCVFDFTLENVLTLSSEKRLTARSDVEL